MEWMILLQFIQGIGAACICLGFRVRKTGWLFIIPYWYMFLLDKTHWNNHSYLFGLMGLIFTLTDRNVVFLKTGPKRNCNLHSFCDNQAVTPLFQYLAEISRYLCGTTTLFAFKYFCCISTLGWRKPRPTGYLATRWESWVGSGCSTPFE